VAYYHLEDEGQNTHEDRSETTATSEHATTSDGEDVSATTHADAVTTSTGNSVPPLPPQPPVDVPSTGAVLASFAAAAVKKAAALSHAEQAADQSALLGDRDVARKRGWLKGSKQPAADEMEEERRYFAADVDAFQLASPAAEIQHWLEKKSSDKGNNADTHEADPDTGAD